MPTRKRNPIPDKIELPKTPPPAPSPAPRRDLLTSNDLAALANLLKLLQPHGQGGHIHEPFSGLFLVQAVPDMPDLFVLGRVTGNLSIRASDPETQKAMNDLAEEGRAVQIEFAPDGAVRLTPTGLSLSNLLEFEVRL